jgi:hypothetical protein
MAGQELPLCLEYAQASARRGDGDGGGGIGVGIGVGIGIGVGDACARMTAKIVERVRAGDMQEADVPMALPISKPAGRLGAEAGAC